MDDCFIRMFYESLYCRFNLNLPLISLLAITLEKNLLESVLNWNIGGTWCAHS